MAQLLSFDAILGIPEWLVALLFFIPFCGALMFYFYKTRYARSWKNGIFPSQLKFNEDHLLEAYLALGALLILLNRQKTKGHTRFLNTYFERYFKMANYNFGDSLLFSLKHPVQINTVTDWLNKNLKSEGERAQVVYFLTGLTFIKESITEKELKLLKLINDQLELPDQNLVQNIHLFERYSEEKNSQQKHSKKKIITRTDRLEHFRRILNVDKKSSKDDIKKQYRKLVKLHHPDAFSNTSEAQKKIAEEKFIKIQAAYEALN